LTGDTGGAISPTAGNINVVGTAGQITVTGTPGTSTLTLSLAGGSTAVDSIAVDAATGPGTNPVVPTAVGLVTMTGGQVASGTVGANVIRTNSVLANNVKLEIQRSAAVAATDSTKNGVAHFSSDEFAVDANGFVTLVGGSEAIDSFIPDSGTSPVVPAANGSVTTSGSGSITTVGGTNTLTTQLTGLTNHAVLVGAGTTTITKVGPSATTGAPLISGGAAADPRFSTTFVINDTNGTATISGNTHSVVPGFYVNNADTAGTALVSAVAAGTANAGFFSSGQLGTTKYWNFGQIPTASTPANGFNITYNPVGQSDPSVPDVGGAIAISCATTGNVTIPVGDLTVTRATGLPEIVVNNTSTSDFSRFRAVAASPKTGFFSSGIDTPLYWNFGMASTLSNAFCLNTSVASVAPEGGSIRFRVSTAGAITFNEAFTFPTADGTAGQVLTTNGAGTVTWSSSGVGTWTDTSGVFTASRNSAYFLTAASTATLPASPAQGDTVDFVCDTTGSCVITGNTGQFIRIASQLSSAAGTATNSARGDTLSLVYRAATTTWFAFDAPNGGWTTA
jgi:hypothetical protein